LDWKEVGGGREKLGGGGGGGVRGVDGIYGIRARRRE
jgi:hypothetical protein